MEKFELSSRKPREPGLDLSRYGPQWTPRRSRCRPVVSELWWLVGDRSVGAGQETLTWAWNLWLGAAAGRVKVSCFTE